MSLAVDFIYTAMFSVRSQCLILNKFFTFLQPKNQPSARKTGSRVASTLCRSKTKNCRGWGQDYHDQKDQLKLRPLFFKKNRSNVARSLPNPKSQCRLAKTETTLVKRCSLQMLLLCLAYSIQWYNNVDVWWLSSLWKSKRVLRRFASWTKSEPAWKVPRN